MTSELIFSCGKGGVGKTTCSAILGLTMAFQGKNVMLVTIDPARRLADSLKISLESNGISTVPLPDCPGSLQAMMLDSAVIFHSFAEENTTEEEFTLLSQNRYFTFARDKMGGIQEYMAILQVMILVRSEKYDVIIIDTPPAQNAIDFLEAPKRLQRLFSSKGLQWLSSSSGFGSLSIGKTLIARGLRRFLGSETISDMTNFFSLFQKVAEHLEEASLECMKLMQSEQTKFWIITTIEHQKSTELLSFLLYLKNHNFRLFGLLINKYPDALPVLTTHQEKILSAEPKIAETIRWIQEKNQREVILAKEQIILQSFELLPKFYIPKKPLHQIDDMVQLAQILMKQLQES